MAVPILARYAITRQVAHRFQADVLGGVTLTNVTVTTDIVPFDAQQQPLSAYQETTSRTGTCLTLGTGVRYALLPQLEITSEFVINTRQPKQTFGNFSGSLRYRFGHSL